jgi:hypothetical protein
MQQGMEASSWLLFVRHIRCGQDECDGNVICCICVPARQ